MFGNYTPESRADFAIIGLSTAVDHLKIVAKRYPKEMIDNLELFNKAVDTLEEVIEDLEQYRADQEANRRDKANGPRAL